MSLSDITSAISGYLKEGNSYLDHMEYLDDAVSEMQKAKELLKQSGVPAQRITSLCENAKSGKIRGVQNA